MELPLIVLRQTLTMAIYMVIGYALFKAKKITKEGSKNIATLLLWIVLPAVIINSFCVAFSLEKLRQFFISFLLAALALAAAILISMLIFKKSPIDHFAAAFSNAGFMGIPLVRACFGDEAVFFLVGFVALLNLLQWTYGVSLLQKEKARISIRQVVLNPIFVAIFIGLLLFITGFGVKLPSVIQGAIAGISSMNAPLAMIVLGVYLAQSDIKSTFTLPRLYGLSAVRLLLIPIVTLILLLMMAPVDRTVKLVILTAAAAPVGSNVAVYAQLHDADYPYACQTVALSTVLSIIALPLIITLGSILL